MITLIGLFVFGTGTLFLCHRGLGEPDGRVWPPWYDDGRDGP